MALERTISFDGVEYPNAYHVVSSVVYNKEDGFIFCRLASYKNQLDKNINSRVKLTTTNYQFDVTDTFSPVTYNMATLCYNYIKSLPEWSGAIDV